MKISVVNKTTGEIMEFNYKNMAEMAMQYDNLQQTIKALQRAQLKMRDTVIKQMKDADDLEAGAYKFKRVITRITNYDKTILSKYFDQDQLEVVLEPNKKKVQELLKELQLPTPALKELDDTMIIKNTSEKLLLEKPLK